jgi:hypothetical protein
MQTTALVGALVEALEVAARRQKTLYVGEMPGRDTPVVATRLVTRFTPYIQVNPDGTFALMTQGEP